MHYNLGVDCSVDCQENSRNRREEAQSSSEWERSMKEVENVEGSYEEVKEKLNKKG